MSASTPLRDEVPHGPLTVSVQDIFDGIVLDASQLNLMLSLGEKVGDQVISEDEEQEDSDREDKGEFGEENKRGSSEALGGVIETEEEDHSESEAGCKKSESGCKKSESRCKKSESGCKKSESGCKKSESGCKKSESGCKKSESGCKGVRQAKTAIVTPCDQAWKMMKTVPVRVGETGVGCHTGWLSHCQYRIRWMTVPCGDLHVTCA